MEKNPQVDELYEQLREAHNMAEKGDKQAAEDAQKIYDHIQSLSNQEFTPTPPILGGVAGAGLGALGFNLPYGAYKFLQKNNQFHRNMGAVEAQNELLKKFNSLAPEIQAQIKLQDVKPTKWTKAVTGADFSGSFMGKHSEDTAEALKSIIGRGGPMAGGSLTETGIALPPKTVQEIKAAEEAKIAAQVAEKSKLSNRLIEGGKQVLGKVGSAYAPIAKVLGPVAGGFGAGYAGAEAYNRANQGDTTGAVLHGLEGVASAASLYPPFAPIAVPAALGLAGVNYLRERNEPKTPEKKEYNQGGVVHMAEGRQPSVSLEELDMTPAETSAAFGKFPQMNPKRAQPQGGALHGYLDALLGAPEYEDLSVLEPKGMAYKNAYRVAEPYGMAANMVAPIASVGKTVGTPLVKMLNKPSINLLNPKSIQFLHGTSPEGKASILSSGKFNPHAGKPSYSYSEIGPDSIFASPSTGWWLNQEKAQAGRATTYPHAVGVDIDQSAKIAHIKNPEDWEKLAKATGFENGKDLYNKLQTENHDIYNKAVNLTPQQYDQMQMEGIQNWQHLLRNEKPGDFHYQSADDWANQIADIAGSHEKALNDPSIIEPRKAVKQITDKGYHGIYIDNLTDLPHNISIPAPEQLAIFDQSKIKPNSNFGYKTGGSIAKQKAYLKSKKKK